MNDNQQKFADMVQQNKSTIYTVCYMFSKDQAHHCMPVRHTMNFRNLSLRPSFLKLTG